MQVDSPTELSANHNLIITLLRKSKPDCKFDVKLNESGIPQLLMDYRILSDGEPYKYTISLDEAATWTNVKKTIDLFETYLKNVNKKQVTFLFNP
jgi:hypothetical protein